jgi:ferredoxin
MRNTQIFAAEHGNRIDYVESLLMVDNYLPGFDIKNEVVKLPEKNTDENLSRIIADISARKKLNAKATIGQRFLAALVQTVLKGIMKDTQAQSYIVSDSCNKCGTCAKICPADNITLKDKVSFGDRCEWCLGCVHLCPKNAIHLKNEKSAERWRNPDVTLAEIIKSNDRTGGTRK